MNYIVLSIVMAAAVYDVSKGKIPNTLVAVAYIFGIGYSLLNGGIEVIPSVLLGMLLPIILLMCLFYIRALGAGDIKLFSALGSMFGLQILEVMLYAFLFGAVQSICRILKNIIRKEHSHQVPFALSILVSVVYVICFQ